MQLACKLATPELRLRRETVLAELNRSVLERTETPGGFLYRFAKTDERIESLSEFMKFERQCCEFLEFRVLEDKEAGALWLEIGGPEGAKEFIKSEMGL